MKAMISGRAGLALIMEGDQLASIHSADPERSVPRHPGEFRHLAGDVRDFIVIDVATRDDVVRELRLAQDREDALQLVLIAQDSELSDGVRRVAIKELEELLQYERVAAFVESVLYSHTLPEGFDLTGAIQRSIDAGVHKVRLFLEFFLAHQEAIREVREAWESIPLDSFGTEGDRWRATIVREGVFRDLARCWASGGNVDVLLAETSLRKTVLDLPNHGVVLQRWARQLATREVHSTRAITGPSVFLKSTLLHLIGTFGRPPVVPLGYLQIRDLSEHDNAENSRLVILNKTLTEQTWSGENLSKRFKPYNAKALQTGVSGDIFYSMHRTIGEAHSPTLSWTSFQDALPSAFASSNRNSRITSAS